MRDEEREKVRREERKGGGDRWMKREKVRSKERREVRREGGEGRDRR